MKKTIIQNGSTIQIKFFLKNENNEIVFGEKSGKIEKVILEDTEPFFDLFKCLIGKESGFEGKFIVNPIAVNTSKIEEISTESLPPYLVFNKNTIIKIGSNNKKFGFITDVQDKKIIVETEKPFKRIKTFLHVSVISVDEV